ncbi:MAG: Ig-like domain-containing protein [Candidatus Aenigmarchaeota archaeon]|nr:Ig-like domain-containing protein [Candidatus Aenigmarchaeota archaeon]
MVHRTQIINGIGTQKYVYRYLIVIILSTLLLIPIALAFSGTGNDYSLTGDIGNIGGLQDASGINVSVIAPTFAIRSNTNNGTFYGGIFCIFNRPPVIALTSVSPSVVNSSQTVTVSAVAMDNDTDDFYVKVYTSAAKTTLLCTGNSVASGGNSSCSFTAGDTGCSEGSCNIFLFAQETTINECEGNSFSVNPTPVTVTFTYDITPPAIFSIFPNTTAVGYAKANANFNVNFSYTDLNARNYSIEIYNGSAQICMTTNTSVSSGAEISTSNICVISGSQTEGYYTLRITVVDNALQTTQNTQTDAVLIDNTAPTGTLTVNPTVTVNGTDYVKGIMPLNATGSDTSSGVEHVEWYYNTTLIGSDSTSPYGIDWDTSALPDGSYNITTRVYDRSGNVYITE